MIILYNNDIKIQREIKCIPSVIINNMVCIKHYIMPKCPELGFVKELLEVCEFNEKLITN